MNGRLLHTRLHAGRLTRLGVAEDRWAAAERRAAAVITAAATAAAQAAAPDSHHHLYLLGWTDWDADRHREMSGLRTMGRRGEEDGKRRTDTATLSCL